MDDPGIDRLELDAALRFIRAVNARLGGTVAALRHVHAWTRGWPSGRELRLLDLGTGSADIPLAIARWALAVGRPARIVAVDNHARALEAAHAWLAAESRRDARSAAAVAAIELVEADARALTDTYRPASFDIVHAGMFLHHLPDIEAVTVLRIMQRLSGVGLIWNDLTRDLLSRLAIRVLVLGTPPKVAHDAIVSVAKGFTRRETLDLARRADLVGATYHRHLFGRFTLTAQS